MTPTPTGIDQSWGYADPHAAYAAGIRVVSMYLSHDPSKNVTPAKVRAYHQAGIAVLLNWEATPGAPLKGAAQGNSDALAALPLVKALIKAVEVDYAPKSKLGVIYSCDTDTTPSQYGPIDAYYANTKRVMHAAGMLNGVYGEFDLINHLHDAGLTDIEWQTYAWSGGQLSPEADFYQYLNGQTLAGASVDFDRVIHAAALGAWWPPGSTYDHDPSEDITVAQAADILNAVAALSRRMDAYFAVKDGGTHPLQAQLLHETRGIPYANDKKAEAAHPAFKLNDEVHSLVNLAKPLKTG